MKKKRKERAKVKESKRLGEEVGDFSVVRNECKKELERESERVQKFITQDFYVEPESTDQPDSLPLINTLNDLLTNE